jgi:uncharacterized protein
MELNENARIDTSQIDDQRGASGGGGFSGAGLPIPIPTGGGKTGLIITLVVVVASILLGGGFGLNALNNGDSNAGGGPGLGQCEGDKPDLSKRDCRNTLYVNSIQAYWKVALPETFGKPYQQAQTVFFSARVSTGCGAADSGVGPFYCPADRRVYIDLNFYDELATRFGARGEFAQPYVLAHEYGHHIQTLLGTEPQVRRAQQRDPDRANEYSVKLELQADCYAGVWSKHATETTDTGGQPLFNRITNEDIAEGLQAAASVGDDAIQKKSTGRIDESKFTHGSSEQRQHWFRTGFDSGDGKACDTFSG